jgi:hypothetical protein
MPGKVSSPDCLNAGGGTKPECAPIDVNDDTIAMATTTSEVAVSTGWARLFRGLPPVRMMKFPSTWVHSDSTSQPI